MALVALVMDFHFLLDNATTAELTLDFHTQKAPVVFPVIYLAVFFLILLRIDVHLDKLFNYSKTIFINLSVFRLISMTYNAFSL